MTFPIVSDAVQLTSAANAAPDVFESALRIENAIGPRVRAALSGPVVFANGLAFDVNDRIYYVDATAGLPANTTYANGLPVTPGGALCVSTDPVATYSNGIPFVANGAVKALVTA